MFLKRLTCLIIFMLHLTTFVARAEPIKPVIFSHTGKVLRIGNFVGIYRDETTKLGIDEAIKLVNEGEFQRSKQQEPNFGPTADAIWIYAEVTNQSDEDIFIEEANQAVDKIDVYLISPTGEQTSYHTGDLYPFIDRPIHGRSFVFPLLKGKGSCKLFIRLEGENPLSAPLLIATNKLIEKRSEKEDYSLFFYTGILIAVISQLFYLFFSVWRRQYIYFILYVVTKSYFLFSIKGYTFAYLFPDDPALANSLATLSIIACMFFGSWFTLSYLNTKARLTNLAQYMYIVPVSCVVVITLFLVGKTILAVYLLGISVLFAGVFSMYLAWLSHKSNYPPARFFLIAFSFPIVVNLMSIGGSLGVLPKYDWYDNLIFFTSALEMVLLTFALADKIGSFSRQKGVLQKQAIEALAEKEKLVKEQNSMLEIKVQERTRELQAVHKKLEDAYQDLTLRNDDVRFFIEEMQNSNEELASTMEQMSVQNNLIKTKNKDIMDSLNYAKKIQSVIMPSRKRMNDHLGEYFVFYRPKTVVSGDFYWFENVGGKVILGVVDCTGHGVPGAFMSIIAYSALIRIVKDDHIIKPSEILTALDRSVVSSLNQYDMEDGIQDGMEIAICTIDFENKHLEYAGAKRPLLVYHNSTGLTEYKGSKTSIGMNFGVEVFEKQFESHSMHLEKGDKLYMFTDGFPDQFGGSSAKKFGRVRFRELISQIGKLEISEQRSVLEEYFENWRGVNEQVDDVLVLGVQI